MRRKILTYVVELLDKALDRAAIQDMLPMQPGDVMETIADVGDLQRDVGFGRRPPSRLNISGFVVWYRDHYKV